MQYNLRQFTDANSVICKIFVRRVDNLERIVIPKEIRRTMRIREGDPLDNSLTLEEKFAIAVHSILKQYKEQAR